MINHSHANTSLRFDRCHLPTVTVIYARWLINFVWKGFSEKEFQGPNVNWQYKYKIIFNDIKSGIWKFWNLIQFLEFSTSKSNESTSVSQLYQSTCVQHQKHCHLQLVPLYPQKFLVSKHHKMSTSLCRQLSKFPSTFIVKKQNSIVSTKTEVRGPLVWRPVQNKRPSTLI